MSDKKMIMIVEDDKPIAEACQMKLQIDGFEVAMAANGQIALDLIKKKRPDLILLDIIMPKMNGFDFLENLKKNPELKDIKVIVMSNLGQEMDIEHGKELGADDYLIKSDSSISDIITKVTSILA